jgi:hypothetical protein
MVIGVVFTGLGIALGLTLSNCGPSPTQALAQSVPTLHRSTSSGLTWTDAGQRIHLPWEGQITYSAHFHGSNAPHRVQGKWRWLYQGQDQRRWVSPTVGFPIYPPRDGVPLAYLDDLFTNKQLWNDLIQSADSTSHTFFPGDDHGSSRAIFSKYWGFFEVELSLVTESGVTVDAIRDTLVIQMPPPDSADPSILYDPDPGGAPLSTTISHPLSCWLSEWEIGEQWMQLIFTGESGTRTNASAFHNDYDCQPRGDWWGFPFGSFYVSVLHDPSQPGSGWLVTDEIIESAGALLFQKFGGPLAAPPFDAPGPALAPPDDVDDGSGGTGGVGCCPEDEPPPEPPLPKNMSSHGVRGDTLIVNQVRFRVGGE